MIEEASGVVRPSGPGASGVVAGLGRVGDLVGSVRHREAMTAPSCRDARLSAVRRAAGSVSQVLNFDRVFPRCRMVVHHGGSGTVAASVAAGIPTLVCSVFADNGFLHPGPRPRRGRALTLSRITPQTLASKMRQALLDPVVARSQEVGRALSADKGGAARAADLIEGVFVG